MPRREGYHHGFLPRREEDDGGAGEVQVPVQVDISRQRRLITMSKFSFMEWNLIGMYRGRGGGKWSVSLAEVLLY
jgi:hypothetical protein